MASAEQEHAAPEQENAALRKAVIAGLKKLGFSYTASVKLFEAYGDEAPRVVREDPYRIAIDVQGIGFKTADAVAAAQQPAAAGHRTAAGILYILTRYATEGHTCIPRGRLAERALELLSDPSEDASGQITRDDIDDALFELTLDGRVTEADLDGVPFVFLSAYLLAERHICSDLMRLLGAEPKPLYADADDMIRETEAALGISLSDGQSAAVRQSLGSGVFVVTGGPGTGKTTITRAVLGIFERAGLKTALAAPTGRAAKRAAEAAGHRASTIHRLLEYYYDEQAREMYFGKNADNRLDCEAVVIDEASMVDALLMEALLAALKTGTRLVVVGDADQLPPVGAGDVLRDMLESGRIPHTVLTEIYRQALGSGIVVNAHRIDRGEYPEMDSRLRGNDNFSAGGDFFMIERAAGTDALADVLRMCSGSLPVGIPDLVPVRDIQVLTAMKKGMLGCVNLNRELQAVLNPPAPGRAERAYGERVFRVGDRVMQTRNNYGLEWTDAGSGEEGRGVFNGDMGVITHIGAGQVTALYDGSKSATYGTDSLMEIEHAYAITVHKSQGSEFPVVIIPVYAAAPMLMTRNLIYTAVTRGRKLVVLVGSTERLRQMIDNDRGLVRYSGLRAFLEAYSDEI